ncbi:Na+/H+ antiporter NhaB [Terasakiispira papahanaumokuakeensis]|uniref:Na(+)/H(+) antiporter NhaB n=1 Tax=Terasakiispira papahanaumokuakeensis TaxID=197479 RepID=A0A1E2V5E4_9GAMM|nr:sodium/proton antiporter NhaB [Terasakiispira papahanaumokuakeensis]ODC02214.1 Na+/H+ antiporter NhaB [Terasakiispira papahanaumokuakeensis]
MTPMLVQGLARNFLGNAPSRYKLLVIFFLLINPVLMYTPAFGQTVAAWALIAEFIFTLSMALKCYPLLPGGLLAIEAVALGMTSVDQVYEEVQNNLEVILLLLFMVAGIHFMKQLLLFIFTKILLGIRSKLVLSLLFCLSAALLSAFLDALTVTAVIISIAVGFYAVYHRVASGQPIEGSSGRADLAEGEESSDRNAPAYDYSDDQQIQDSLIEDLDQFRAFLRSLLMHGAIGTALGGVSTMVGEPQNLLIAQAAGWDFITFFLNIAVISLPVLLTGLVTCCLVESFHLFGYGTPLPQSVRTVLKRHDKAQRLRRNERDIMALWVQGGVAIFLILALAFHLAEVGLVGLAVIILLTSLNGVNEEHQIGRAFQEALPFTALLVVFFTIVAVIQAQQLFHPFIEMVLHLPEAQQPGMLFIANGLLSSISDNVFVATVYVHEIKDALMQGAIDRPHFEQLAIAVNTGTNLPSVATPNGQAAFLFLLTSAIAPLVRLSYGRMVWMALPYTLSLSVMGLIGVTRWL